MNNTDFDQLCRIMLMYTRNVSIAAEDCPLYQDTVPKLPTEMYDSIMWTIDETVCFAFFFKDDRLVNIDHGPI